MSTAILQPMLLLDLGDDLPEIERTPLSEPERERLTACEEIIREGRIHFLKTGAALTVVRNDRLYREEFSTFRAYLEEKWEISAQYAYQLIAAAGVHANVSAIADTAPANEAQTRPLQGLPPEEQQAAWKEAVETAPEGKVTAEHVKETVKRRRGPDPAEEAARELVAERGKHDYRGWDVGHCLSYQDKPDAEVAYGEVEALVRGRLLIGFLGVAKGAGASLAPDDPRLTRITREELEAGVAAQAPVEPEVDEAEGADEVEPMPEPPVPLATAATPAAQPPRPGALRTAEEIVQANAGKAVPTTVGAATLDAPVTMCMVAQDCVQWLQGDGLNVKSFLLRVKAAAYTRGLDATGVLSLLEAPNG